MNNKIQIYHQLLLDKIDSSNCIDRLGRNRRNKIKGILSNQMDNFDNLIECAANFSLRLREKQTTHSENTIYWINNLLATLRIHNVAELPEIEISLSALSKIAKVYHWEQSSAIVPLISFLTRIATLNIYDQDTVIEVLLSLNHRLIRAQRTGTLATIFLLVDILRSEIDALHPTVREQGLSLLKDLSNELVDGQIQRVDLVTTFADVFADLLQERINLMPE